MGKYVDKFCIDVALKTTEYCDFLKGHDRYTMSNVVLKAFRLPWLRKNDAMHKKILNESNILDPLQFQYIVKPVQCLQTKNNMYIVFQYYEEGNLKNYIQRKNRLDILEATVKLRKMLEILVYLKTKGIVHRNIKSSSFFIKSNELYLSNFLDAIEISNEEHDDSDVWNKNYSYTSPENFLSHIYTFKSDLFSVGMIFYEMLIGKPAFSHTEIALLNGRTGEIDFRSNARNFNWSIELIEFLKKILAAHPEKRFSVEEALQFIDKYFSKFTKLDVINKIDSQLTKEETFIVECFDAMIKKVRFLNRFGDMLFERYSENELANFLLFFLLKVINFTIKSFQDFISPNSSKGPVKQFSKLLSSREFLRIEELVLSLYKESLKQLTQAQKILKGNIEKVGNDELIYEVENLYELKYWNKMKTSVVHRLMEKFKFEDNDFTGAQICEEFIRFYEYSLFDSTSEF